MIVKIDTTNFFLCILLAIILILINAPWWAWLIFILVCVGVTYKYSKEVYMIEVK